MLLFRVIHWDGHSTGRTGAGPLFVPRHHQGAGRHDAPELYGAWYGSLDPVAAVAERLQPFRGQTVEDADFRRLGNLTLALVALRLDASVDLVDLDDPRELVQRKWRPSLIATRRRPVTQQQARQLFHEGAVGFTWWSTLSADWTNVTLFHERALPSIAVATPPTPLSTALPQVQQAATAVGVQLAK